MRLLVVIIALVLFAALLLNFGLLRRWLFSRRIARARVEFARLRKTLEQQFFEAAAASGKPRGLAWTQCDFQNDLLLARDRANGDLVGLVGIAIGFEAIEGGGMEEVEAVRNLRAATAVFRWTGRNWTTQGRAIFNLEPREVLERYTESLTAI